MTPTVFVVLTIGNAATLMLLVLTHAWYLRRIAWSRSTKALGWVVARKGDNGEEYRSGNASASGSWSSDGASIYLDRIGAERLATHLQNAYVLPLRLDQRKGLHS